MDKGKKKEKGKKKKTKGEECGYDQISFLSADLYGFSHSYFFFCSCEWPYMGNLKDGQSFFRLVGLLLNLMCRTTPIASLSKEVINEYMIYT